MIPAQSYSSGGWWSSLLSSAREKSTSALSATTRDLAEFISVVSNDTKAAVSGAGTSIRGLLDKVGVALYYLYCT